MVKKKQDPTMPKIGGKNKKNCAAIRAAGIDSPSCKKNKNAPKKQGKKQKKSSY